MNATEAYLTPLYIQALTTPDSNIQYIIIIIIMDGGNQNHTRRSRGREAGAGRDVVVLC